MLISDRRYKLSVRTLLIDASTKLEVVEDIEIFALFWLSNYAINQHKHQDPKHYHTEESVVLVLRLRFLSKERCVNICHVVHGIVDHLHLLLLLARQLYVHHIFQLKLDVN